MHFTIDTDLAIAGIVLGLLAIAMAAPPLFQMLFGRPDLSFEADDFTGPEGRILVLAIKNQSVKNKFLRRIGVEREATDVITFFDVQELGTGKIVARSVSGLLNCAPLRTMGLQARALPNFTTGLAVINTRNGQASIIDAKAENNLTPISPGHYVARIAVVRGEYTYRIDQAFRVATVDHETIWDRRHVDSIRE